MFDAPADFDPTAFDPRDVATRLLLQNDLYYFTRYGFMQQRGFKWKRNWHHEKICRTLEAVTRGEIKRLIINIPPRYSKTELAVVNFVPWCLAKWPDCEFIHISYASHLALKNSGQAKTICESKWYKNFFPETKLDPRASAKGDWRTTKGGVVYATGSDGSITGFGAGKLREGFAGAIIIDDPHKPNEAQSDTVRKNVVENYDLTIQSRINTPDTPIIVIMQRLHEEDLSGWLLAGGSGEEWHHLNIPALLDDEDGNPTVPLWPEKHNYESLCRIRKGNSYMFAGQYMQLPSPVGGGIFKDDWWGYYNPEILPDLKFKRIIQSWDTAFKSKEENDESVCTTWGEHTNGYYLLDCWHGRVEYPELKRTAVSLFQKWKPNTILIEDKASGQSLLQDLKQTKLDGGYGRLPIIPIKVDSDKITRAFATTGTIESGQVLLPEYAPWLTDFKDQFTVFPNGKHDDIVDSTTQAINYFIGAGARPAILDYYKRRVEALQQAVN